MISNIWKFPTSSIIGVLLAVTTIAGVLSQQGVTLGHIGTGTGVALVSALAVALTGLLSRGFTPSDQSTNSTSKLGAWALIAVLMPAFLIPAAGCNGVTVAQDIVNWTPALQSSVNTVSATLAVLLPADAPAIAVATGAFDGLSTLVASAAQSYLNNPNATTLQFLQTQVLNFQKNVTAALLAATRIVDPQTQRLVLGAINGVATIVQTLIALIASIRGNTIAANKTVAANTLVIRRYRDAQQSERIIAAHYRITQERAQAYINTGELSLLSAGA